MTASSATQSFEIFLVAVPGLEHALCDEVRDLGFAGAEVTAGGVTFVGTWPDVWRANLMVRGATRILARIASFRAQHLAQLDKRAASVDWPTWLRPGTKVAVEAVCRKSRIYHSGAAAERVERALVAGAGMVLSDEPDAQVMVRIDRDVVTISLDTSGEGLHRRGFKQAVAKAPMRETMAALFLRQCGFDGQMSVVDPMCGSGTFVIEAAECALGLHPGRARSFAFEHFVGFDKEAWEQLTNQPTQPVGTLKCFGYDRDAGAVRMAKDNADRAGVSAMTQFGVGDIADLRAPEGDPGLVIVNPPYGGRIGKKAPLINLHRTFGQVMRERFTGWRVGLITADRNLADATGLGLEARTEPVLHGGLRVQLYQGHIGA